MQGKFAGACFNSFGFCLRPIHGTFCACGLGQDQDDFPFLNDAHTSKGSENESIPQLLTVFKRSLGLAGAKWTRPQEISVKKKGDETV